MKLMVTAHTKRLLLAVIISALVGSCVWGLFHIHPKESIQGLIPASLREQVELFERSPLNRKVFAVVLAQDEETALEQAQLLQEELLERNLIKPGFVPTADTALALVRSLPTHFSTTDMPLLQDKLTPQSIRKSMEDNYEKLIGLESFLVKPLLQIDPLHLIEIMTRKLALLNPHTAVRYEEGFLTSQDGKLRAGMYDLATPADFSSAQKMNQIFRDFSTQLPAGTEAFFLGGLRYTAENVTAIRHDLWKIGALALLSLAIIFAVFLRNKLALLIYVLPLIVTPVAALITYKIFGQISGITLGFGSVVAGLSVDYAVYVFYAMEQGGKKIGTRRHVTSHLWAAFLTSSLCFAALFASSIEIFRQIAVFAIAGLFLSLLLALYVLPVYWQTLPCRPVQNKLIFKNHFLSKRGAWMWIGLLLLLGIWGVQHTHFSTDIQSLNALSTVFKNQRQALEQTLGNQTHQALLFIKGNTQEDALEHNEQFARQFQLPLATAEVFPSQHAALQHKTAWHHFWTAEQINTTRKQITQEAVRLGLTPQAFEPFFEMIENAAHQPAFDMTQFYDPLVPLADGSWAVVNLVPDEKNFQAAAEKFGAIFISGPVLQRTLLTSIKEQAVRVVWLAILINLIAVSLLFGSVRKALVAFLPVLLAACFTFACFALLKVEVNLFVLVFLPLLTGLGIDYGIFQLVRAQMGANEQTAYTSQALWVAALSTLAGFGVLIFASHGVLFIMGLSSFLGISGAVLAAQFILPPLLKESK